MKNKIKMLMLTFLYLALLCSAVGCSILEDEQPYSDSSFLMGTFVTTKVYGDDGTVAKKSLDEVAELEEKISHRVPMSDIAKVNSARGKKVNISEETAEIIKTSLDVSKKTNGEFDVTILPLTTLWDFDNDVQTAPNIESIKDALSHVSYKNIAFDEDKKTLSLSDIESGIDLGSAGKGAACDAVLSVYQASGKSGIISVGGSIGVCGKKPNGEKYLIGVRDPFNDSGTICTLALENSCISTSGSYEKSFEQDGVLYHHILSAKTGYPVQTELVSVTVTAESGTVTDILSTACFIIGEEKSIPLLEAYNAKAIFIYKDGTIKASKGLEESLQATDGKTVEYI